MGIVQPASRTCLLALLLSLASSRAIFPTSCLQGDGTAPVPSHIDVVLYGGVGLAKFCLDCLRFEDCPMHCEEYCGRFCAGRDHTAPQWLVCDWCREEWDPRSELPECGDCLPPDAVEEDGHDSWW